MWNVGGILRDAFGGSRSVSGSRAHDFGREVVQTEQRPVGRSNPPRHTDSRLR
jgi:hypothetical protein